MYTKKDLILALLEKELQIHSCFCDWEEFGMDISGWHIDLGIIILKAIGFQQMNDELLTWFYTTLNDCVAKLKAKESTLNELASWLYSALQERQSNNITSNGTPLGAPG